MILLLAPLLLIISSVTGFSIEPAEVQDTSIQPFVSGWGKGVGTGLSHSQSKLDTIGDLKKTKDLDSPISTSIIQLGRSIDGLAGIKNRIIDVRITNPNPYPVFFQGRQYKDNKTIKPIWNKLEGGHWVLAGWDWCGRGIRDWNMAPHETMSLMLYLHSDLNEQQILGRFYRVDDPSVQSDCLLYEKR